MVVGLDCVGRVGNTVSSWSTAAPDRNHCPTSAHDSFSRGNATGCYVRRFTGVDQGDRGACVIFYGAGPSQHKFFLVDAAPSPPIWHSFLLLTCRYFGVEFHDVELSQTFTRGIQSRQAREDSHSASKRDPRARPDPGSHHQPRSICIVYGTLSYAARESPRLWCALSAVTEAGHAFAH